VTANIFSNVIIIRVAFRTVCYPRSFTFFASFVAIFTFLCFFATILLFFTRRVANSYRLGIWNYVFEFA